MGFRFILVRKAITINHRPNRFVTAMLTPNQNSVIYLMLLNGVLFLGLNFIAYSLVFPGPRGSKRVGYLLIVAVLLAFGVQIEYRHMLFLGFSPSKSLQILLYGFVLPVFLVSTVYYRLKRNRLEKKKRSHAKTLENENESD